MNLRTDGPKPTDESLKHSLEWLDHYMVAVKAIRISARILNKKYEDLDSDTLMPSVQDYYAFQYADIKTKFKL